MIIIYTVADDRVICETTDEQLDVLRANLTEEGNHTFLVSHDVLEDLEENGLSLQMVSQLTKALDGRSEINIRWEREEDQ